MSKPDPRIDAARRMASHFADLLQADLSLRLWTGEVLPLGPNARDDILLRIESPSAVRRLMLRPGLMTVFELVAEGLIAVEGGSVLDAYDRWDHGKAIHLIKTVDKGLILKNALPFLFGRSDRGNAVPTWDARGEDGVGAKRSGRKDKAYIAFHYDVSNAFYQLFLDPEMAYSCGYYADEDTSLAEAQTAKFDRICRKLRVKPGDRLLDIGCGWAGLSCWAAEKYGAKVLGVTLSEEQLAFGRAKVEAAGLSGRVELKLLDYREVTGKFDKIAQCEMFEHVGFANHDAHFTLMHKLLKPGGLYFHQASVRRGGSDPRNIAPTTDATRVMARFIFPGGELDTIGMTVTNLGRLGFEVSDVEDLRDHYMRTTRSWSERLYANRAAAEAEVGPARVQLWLMYF
ncbi:MAG: class I SAM-dependent methyltransferase, partial [Brevundimonas sp.]